MEDPDSYTNITDEQIDEWAKQKAKDSQKKQGGMAGMGGGAPPADAQPDKKPAA